MQKGTWALGHVPLGHVLHPSEKLQAMKSSSKSLCPSINPCIPIGSTWGCFGGARPSGPKKADWGKEGDRILMSPLMLLVPPSLFWSALLPHLDLLPIVLPHLVLPILPTLWRPYRGHGWTWVPVWLLADCTGNPATPKSMSHFATAIKELRKPECLFQCQDPIRIGEQQECLLHQALPQADHTTSIRTRQN